MFPCVVVLALALYFQMLILLNTVAKYFIELQYSSL